MKLQDQLNQLFELQKNHFNVTKKMLDIMSVMLKSLPNDNSNQTDTHLININSELKSINEKIDRIFSSMQL